MLEREESLLRFKLMFKDAVFMLNREVPKYIIRYFINGFGGVYTEDE
jgi:hypothetical protein